MGIYVVYYETMRNSPAAMQYGIGNIVRVVRTTVEQLPEVSQQLSEWQRNNGQYYQAMIFNRPDNGFLEGMARESDEKFGR